ncbi:MAG: hypothetical protein L3J71_03880 [Victivallaceae bacterium]|nr:hypothetical protein [Victivallaceae bacterium]
MIKKCNKKIIYVFPQNDNFREKSQDLMFSDFYGLIDGYGLMFDPAVMAVIQTIPEYSNGFPDKIDSDTIIISGSSQTNIPNNDFSGLIVKSGNKISEKESLKLGRCSLFYPSNLNYLIFPDSNYSDWTLAGQAVLQRDADVYTLGIELFNMLDRFRTDKPEARLIMIADVFAELFGTTLYKGAGTAPVISDDFRLDCQAYGINRFLVNWLGELFAENVEFEKADSHYQQAVTCSINGEMDTAVNELTFAFQALAKIRKVYSQSEFKFIEVPHIGILFEDVGFFEFEWPEFTRIRIEKLLDFAENSSSKVAFEAGGSCWKNFTKRYPATMERLNKAIEKGQAAVTNGTFSLPYALYSPIGMQYWQLEFGLSEHKNIFTNNSPVYQCQENSFTPIMPQLLNYFDYKSTMHVVQNRGQSPSTKKQFFKWRGADGSTIQSMGVTNEELGRKGCNYFYDLPLILKENTHMDEIYYPNFQDIGFVPLRTQIYRSTRYANIWGEFLLPGELPYTSTNDECFFQPEDYCLAETEFYPRATCINSLSQLERVYRQYNKLRYLQFAAWSSGELEKNIESLSSFVPEILIQEAHDVVACQGQKVGEFYESNALLKSPVEERYLYQKANDLSNDFNANLSGIAEKINQDIPCSKIEFSSLEAVIANNKLRIELCGRVLDIAIFDRKHGDFEINKVSKKTDSVVIDAYFKHDGKILHQAALILRYSADISLLELELNYSSNAEFSYLDKWKDYLGISIEIKDGLGALTHCTPGYRTEAHKSLIVSPYFLNVQAGFSLLNEGTPYYEKLNDKTISWMFHNYGESVHSRRMAIYFGKNDPMQAAANWSCNCKPGGIEHMLNLPEQFNAEVFIEADKLLAVSLCDTDITKINNITIPGHKEKPEKITAGTLAIFKLKQEC